jgi:DNA-binding response OmpR family regulator
MKRVLVTQRDKRTTQEVASVLTEQGFEVEDANDIDEALQMVKRTPWDLIILDIRGPQGDGFEACQYVREYTTAPVVILSEHGRDEYIIKALSAGADQYVVKPVSTKVFLAHVYALLRRTGRMRETTQSGVFKQGDLIIDFDRHEAAIRGKPVQLTVSEFRLLSCLAHNPGRVLSSRNLVREVQGYDCSPQEARDIIKVHIHNLRKKLKLGAKEPPYIRNVRGVGYVFERRSSSREESVNRILT